MSRYVITAFLEEVDGSYERFDEIRGEYVYDEKTGEKCLRGAGLKALAMYDGYSFSPATPQSKRISFVAGIDE